MKPFVPAAALFLAQFLGLALPAAAQPLLADGPGCTDKAIGAKLATLTDMDPEYITIWAKGMQDQSCRGYSQGADVTVEDRADGIVCIRAADDSSCFWVRANMVE